MARLTKRELLGAPLVAAGLAALPSMTRAQTAATPPAPRAPLQSSEAPTCQPAPRPAASYALPMASGPFTAARAALETYQTPAWFQDAKFGIWAHWGPQAVPRVGDWYARNMYIPGHPHYAHHVKTYGHPTVFGYKDIIPLWKAERFDPDALMALYARAGAKYFVSMGVHHDNFDLWNSKHHRWNAAAMGPKRDIVGDFRKAALNQGLRFGVSEHLGPSYSWFYPSHMYDQVAPKGGQWYDGSKPEFADLYHPTHTEPFRWGRSWYARNPVWHQQWYDRIKDLIDQHQPDFLYTDGGIPFGEVGRSLVAHLYNSNMAAHGGKLEAVYTAKDMGTGEFFKQALVQDVERGVMDGIQPLPWQTCTSIGDWYYSEGFKYKTTAEVVHLLSDIVSKNGNMLLNVVLYPEGDLPPEARRFVDEMAAWMSVNGEAIHGTRPWRIFGEGPTAAAAGHFREDVAYTAQDIRFTTRGRDLYAISLGQPKGQLKIAALGSAAEKRRVRTVHLVGQKAPLTFTQGADGLVINVPPALPTAHASAFRIVLSA